METKKTRFALNLEFFRENLGYSQEIFCLDVLKINKNSYTNYLNGGMPSPEKLRKIVEQIVAAVEEDDLLAPRFPAGTLTPIIMKEKDVSSLEKSEAATEFYWRKFLGNYVCYYMSTNIKGDKQTQYGVLQIREGERPSKFVAYGVFSLKDDKDVFKIYDTLQEGKHLEDIVEECQIKSLFDGKAYLSNSLLWINLSNVTRSEHVSLSFDLDSKIVTKNPQRIFAGTRGIALSQTSGQGNQTVTFPMVVTRYPLEKSINGISESDLTKFLHFSYKNIDDKALSDLTDKIINLEDSLRDNAYLVEMRGEILKRYLNNAILSILSAHIYNSHYFRQDEAGEFYKEIIKPSKAQYETNDNKDE